MMVPRSLTRLSPLLRSTYRTPRYLSPISRHSARRTFASKTEADAKIEELQELYATAKDEFEIATEETEKKSVYAREDRAAAREELAKLKEAFTDATQSSETDVSTEIKGRVGQRIRELEGAIEELNKADFED